MKILKTFFTSTIFLPSISLAAKIGQNKADQSALAFIVRLINFILEFTLALTALFIIIGGLMYMTCAGNEDKIKVAKKTLTYAIIGLVIVVASLAIVNFTKSTLLEVVK